MKNVCIIQARMGSTRLPGKVMMPLDGRPVLHHVIERVSRSKRLDDIVIATTHKAEDDLLVEECERLNVHYSRGSELDVLSRYIEAAEQFNADIITRVTSDCPLIDPAIIDLVLETRENENADYASLSGPRSYPRGLDNEAFTMESFRKVAKKATAEYERVHVTPYYYLHEDEFRMAHVHQADDFSNLRWTLDTPDDYKALSMIFDKFKGRNDMNWREVLDIVQKHPEITAANAHIEQKKLEDL